MSNTAYFDLINAIKEFFDPRATALSGGVPYSKIKTITTGDIYEIDLSKQTIFPLGHIIVNNVQQDEHFYTFNVSFLVMDIVDINKEEGASETTNLYGNNNEADILNESLSSINFLDRDWETLKV